MSGAPVQGREPGDGLWWDRALLWSLPVGVVVHGGDGRILQCNPAACDLLGLTEAQLTGLTSLDPRWRAVHEDGSDFPGDTHPAEVARRTGQDVTGVTMGVHRTDGSLVWISVTASRLSGDRSDDTPAVIATFTDVTELIELRRAAELAEQRFRALAEEAAGLRQRAEASEARYRIIAENASDVVALGSVDGHLLWVSPAVRSLLGLDAAELTGLPLADLVHPDDLPVVASAQQALQDDGRTEAMTLRLRTAEGGWRWVAGTVRVARDERGSEIGRVATWTDGEAVHRERLAQEHERALRRATFQAAIDPHVFVEPVRDATGAVVDFTYADANEAACATLDLERDQLVGRRMLDLFPATATGLFLTYIEALERGEPFAVDDYAAPTSRMGTSRRYDIRAVPAEGGLSFTWRDVTDRHELVEALSESEERFRMLAEHATDLVARIEVGSNRIEWISPSCERLTGYSVEELVGRSSREFQHPDDLAAWQQLRDLEEAGTATAPFVHQFPRKDGTRVWVETVSEIVPAADDRPAYRLVRARDVDAQMHAQLELEQRARTDTLTGLLTRREGWQRLRRDLADERRSGEQVAVMFVDLDRFKTINDTRGHQVGDAVLVAVATRVRAAVRDDDYVVRIGGDEILVVLNGVADLEAELGVAEKVRAAAGLPLTVDGEAVAVTASVGLTMARPHDLVTDVVQRADRAMYRAKATGRNRVVPAT